MDFVSGFPLTQQKHDSVWVIVDRLTKSAHFIPIRIDYSMDRLVELYVDEIVCLHGVPLSIVLDRDPRFKVLEGTTVSLRYEAEFQYGIPSAVRWTVQKVNSST